MTDTNTQAGANGYAPLRNSLLTAFLLILLFLGFQVLLELVSAPFTYGEEFMELMRLSAEGAPPADIEAANQALLAASMEPVSLFSRTAASMFLTFLFAWWWASRRGHVAALGLDRHWGVTTLLLSVPGGLMLYAMGAAVNLPLFSLAGVEPEDLSSPLIDVLRNVNAFQWGLAFLAVVIAAPLAEELLFRGYLQGAFIAKGAPVALAIVLQAAIFTLPHGVAQSVWVLPGLFMVGVGLGLLRVWSKGLALPIVAHMVFNGAQISLLPFADEIEAWGERMQESPGLILMAFAL